VKFVCGSLEPLNNGNEIRMHEQYQQVQLNFAATTMQTLNR
jgi:hypothetical protein